VVKQSGRALKKAIADELLGFFWGQLVQSRRANPKQSITDAGTTQAGAGRLRCFQGSTRRRNNVYEVTLLA
jgi:hypothetical protein